jgi:predicted N-acyltransferase
MAQPPESTLTVSVAETLSSIPGAAWDALDHGRSPFTRYAFLEAMERSGSIGPKTGWQPLFLLAWEGTSDRLVGAVPAFVKSHSYGEYIFDWAWARGAEAAGIRYYPKLVVAVPFTPVTGRRILLAPGADARVGGALAQATRDLAQQLSLSSVHWLFIDEPEEPVLQDAGFLPRLTQQYHWRNQGWTSFEGFLGSLRSKRRREVRREQRMVHDAGITVRMIPGPECEDRHWAAADAFYRHTCGRKWNDPYFEPGFFERIRETFADHFVFCAAEKDGEVLAGSIFFRRGDALYGRHWGRREDVRVKGLHFDVCYHTPIAWAIAQGIELYEAGAQGEHKVARGFLPAPIRSAHWIADPRLAGGVARFLAEEREHTAVVMDYLDQRTPFRRGDDGPLPAGEVLVVPDAVPAEGELP